MKIRQRLIIFTKKGFVSIQLDIAGTMINTKNQMKVLGVLFDCNLTWEPHIRATLAKCNSKIGVLKKIRKMFTVDQFLKIITSQYFSILYYGCKVWLNNTTRKNLRGLINTAHYRPLRVALFDFEKRLSKNELSKRCKRATPSEWVRYSLASTVLKVYKHREPFYLYMCLNETLCTIRRKPLM